jgi:hypothetical protein
MKAPKIYYVNWVLPPYRGMTIPPFGIFIKKTHKGNKRILNHDLVHWKQYLRLGLFLFYIRYFFQLIIFGYDKMPMEKEARFEESLYRRTHYTSVYHRPIRKKIINKKRK